MTRKKTTTRKKRQDPIEQAETAGIQYATDQLEADYFTEWVHSQIIEASRMDPSEVLPLKTKADARVIAKNMLQQIEWDVKRDLRNHEVERLTGVPATREANKAFLGGLHRGLSNPSTVDWLADEILDISGKDPRQETLPGIEETAQNAPADVLRTLQPGDMVTIESPELPKPRKLVVTSLSQGGGVYVSSGAVRPGHRAGGRLHVRDGVVFYDATIQQRPVRVSRLTRTAAALAEGGGVSEAQRGPEPGPTSLTIDGGFEARRLKTGKPTKTLGASTETWVVHRPGEPGQPVLQVDIFKPAGKLWAAWTGNFTRARDREIAERVAAARNGTGEARTMRESRPEPVEDPFYIIQGLYNDGTLVGGTESGSDDEAGAIKEAKDMARSNWFEGDYFRVITRDGELVWDSRGNSRGKGPRVRDYAAVDPRDRVIAGPFKHHHEAQRHAGPGGHVKFVPRGGAVAPTGARRPPRT